MASISITDSFLILLENNNIDGINDQKNDINLNSLLNKDDLDKLLNNFIFKNSCFIISIDNVFFIEEKKYFEKIFFNYYCNRKTKEDQFRPTCKKININNEVNQLSHKNLSKEIFNEILEFLNYFFYHPWHHLDHLDSSTNRDTFKEKIIFKKRYYYLEDGPDNVNTLPYWNEHHQYFFYINKGDTIIKDEIPFWKINEDSQEWYTDWIYKKDFKNVCKIGSVANYLDIKPLLDLCIARIAVDREFKDADRIIRVFELN